MFKIIAKYFMFFALGVVLTLLAQKGFSNFRWTHSDESRVMLKVLKEKVLEFRKACGKLPSVENGLNSLVEPSLEGCSIAPLLPLVPHDPWDGELTYIRAGEKAYLLSSRTEGSFVEI